YADFMRTRAAKEDLGTTRASFTVQEARLAEQLSVAADAFKQAPSPVNRAKFEELLHRVGVALASGDGQVAAPRSASAEATTLDQGVAVIRYVVAPDRLRILFTSRGRERQRDAPLRAVVLNRQVFEFREQLQNPRSDPHASARVLYGELIQPIEPDLRA